MISTLVTPAIYFYLGLLCVLFSAFRMQNPKLLLFYFPAALQTAVLTVFNQAPELRYQYGVTIISLFSIGLFLLSLTIPSRSSCPVIQTFRQESSE